MSTVNPEDFPIPEGMEVQPLPNLARFDRLTMVLAIHHEHFGDQPLSYNIVAHQQLAILEQPFSRRVRVTEEWMELPLGWMNPEWVGGILLENLTGKNLTTNPTDAERKALDETVLLVSFSKKPEESWRLQRSWPFWGVPLANTPVYLRTEHHEADIRLTIYPR